MEQLDYNLLFRWFVGLSADEAMWHPTVFSKNRERMLGSEIAAAFMDAVLNLEEDRRLLSSEHFSADGTLIKAWARSQSDPTLLKLIGNADQMAEGTAKSAQRMADQGVPGSSQIQRLGNLGPLSAAPGPHRD